MSSFTKKRKDGFTIIEVMIVLAIAGLIMLIVFLAVPALQRTARNTQRKDDASAIAAALANYIDNNGGTLPTGIGNAVADTSTLVIGSTAPACTLTGTAWSCNTENAKLGYYTANTTGANVTPLALQSGNVWMSTTYAGGGITIIPTSGTASATSISTNTISIITGWNCNGTNTGVSATANSRTVAVLYVTETGSGNGSLQCVEQ